MRIKIYENACDHKIATNIEIIKSSKISKNIKSSKISKTSEGCQSQQAAPDGKNCHDPKSVNDPTFSPYMQNWPKNVTQIE